jgi:hypothetical protein
MNDEEYEAFLERGRHQLETNLRKAQLRNLRTWNCDAGKNCNAEHHLCICPKFEKEVDNNANDMVQKADARSVAARRRRVQKARQ